MVQKMGQKVIEAFPNSRLIVGQVRCELEARDVRMQEYLGHSCHILEVGSTSNYPCRGFVQDKYNQKGYNSNPLGQSEFELDGSHSEFSQR